MIELGKKETFAGANEMTRLEIYGKPKTFPALREGHSLVCGYDQGLGERLFVCEDLDDMIQLYDAYNRGGALQIKWYSAYDPGFIILIPGQ